MLKNLLHDPARTILTIGGIPVRVHASFLLMPLWAACVGWLAVPWHMQGALFLGLFIILLYALAMFHELGHIVPAHLFGARITRVRVSFVGAFVQVETPSPMGPGRDLIIALGGPTVSALLSGILAYVGWRGLQAYMNTPWTEVVTRNVGLSMLLMLAAANVVLTVFNILPFFPMDGGRALSAALGLVFSPARATRLVSAFGQVTAVAVLPTALLLPTDLLIKLAVALVAPLIFAVSLRAGRLATGVGPAEIRAA